MYPKVTFTNHDAVDRLVRVTTRSNRLAIVSGVTINDLFTRAILLS